MSRLYDTNLHVELVQGDDYKLTDGRALTFYGQGVCWPAVAPSEVRFCIYDHPCCQNIAVANGGAKVALTVTTGTYTPATTTEPAKAEFDLARADTLLLECGVRRYQFEVRALMPSGSVITLATGHVTVIGTFA